jgi:transcriptional regulator with XRE-family HTH domain
VSRSISIRDPQTRARSALFGQVVRAYRVNARLTQEALARKAGVDRQSVNRIENAAYATNLPRIFRLADALGVRPAALFAGTIPPPPNGDRPSVEEAR